MGAGSSSRPDQGSGIPRISDLGENDNQICLLGNGF
jgi:hypothetical protein